MWDQPQSVRGEMEDFLKDLNVPLTFVNVHVAWRSCPEIAIQIWLRIGNYQSAHDLLVSNMTLPQLSQPGDTKLILDRLSNFPISNWRENGLTLL